MPEFEVTIKFIITNEEIADLLVTAFEGGINYWCEEVELHIPPSDDYDEDKDFMSELLHHGGELKLIGVDGDAWILTEDKFIEGIKHILIDSHWSVEELMYNQDADIADQIIQYALFNEIIFG